jgi:hypothetical protein
VHLAKQFLMLLWASCMVQRWFFISASLHLWLAASFRAYVWVSLFSNSPLNLLICLMVDVSAIWTLQCPGHSKCFGGVNVCLIHLLFTWRLAQLFVVIAFEDGTRAGRPPLTTGGQMLASVEQPSLETEGATIVRRQSHRDGCTAGMHCCMRGG